MRKIPNNLVKKLGVKFKNINLLKTALTHRSYLNEHRDKKIEHNERLEFFRRCSIRISNHRIFIFPLQ